MTDKNLVQVKNNEFPTDITEILNELKKSPAFAMSRGGRELFHTNFISFILEQITIDPKQKTYIHEVKESMLKTFFGKDTAPNNVLVFREKSNLDLIIVPVDQMPELLENHETQELGQISSDLDLTICIIEAKLKSIPTKNQLISYSNKLDTTITIDLNDDNDSKLQIKKRTKKKNKRDVILKSTQLEEKLYSFNNIKFNCLLLAPESFLIDQINKIGWSNLNWKSLLCDIEEFDLTYKNNDENHKLNTFVSDYITSTNLVIDLIQKVTETVDKFEENNINLDALFKFTIHSSFKKLKLHDLVGKVAYEYLAKKILQKVLHNKNEIISYQAFMTNSTPGFQIEFTKSDDKKQCGFGVQLQGTDYRHFIRRNYIDESNKLAECIDININNWMKADGNRGIENKNTNFDEFKKFNINKFLYKSRNVEKNSFEELCIAFNRSLDIKNYDEWLNNIFSTKT